MNLNKDTQVIATSEEVHRVNLSDVLKPMIFDNGSKFVYIIPILREEDDARGKCTSCYGYPSNSEMCEMLSDQCGLCEGGISDFYGIPVYYYAPAEVLREITKASEPSCIREMNFSRSLKEMTKESLSYRSNKNSKKGFVYFASSLESSSVKIGSTRNISSRMSQLSTSSPSKIRPIFSFLCENRLKAERLLHSHFAKKRLNGEWFSLSKDEIELAKEKEFLRSIGINATEIIIG